MALLFYSQFDSPDQWRTHLAAAMPELAFRVWPDVGDPNDIEAALVWKPPAGELRKFPQLKLIVNLGAGVDSIVKDTTLPSGVPITRLADPEMGRMMSQFILAAVLRHHREFVSFARAQRERRWHYIHPHETAERTVGLMGLGQLGATAAAELARQGFQVRGWSRTEKQVPGVRCFHGQDGLAPFLNGCEILIVLLPLTAQTEGLVNASVFQQLPRGAKFISVGRGRVIDEVALVAALQSGQIAEATLDVFQVEPLPEDSPLWQMEQVLITPHLASVAIPRTAAAQVAENIQRVRAGLAPLNVVDPQRGY